MKAVIITGISRGLGKAIFDILCKKQIYLICLSRRFLPEQLKCAEEKKEYIKLIYCELSKTKELNCVKDLLAALVIKKTEEVVFINNAAVIEPIGAIGKLDDDLIIEAININLITPILLTNALLEMRKNCMYQLKVLNISTGAADRAIVGWPIYCSAKAGSKMFFNVLKEQGQEHTGLSVFNIDPGVMDTNMQQIIGSSAEDNFPLRDYFNSLREEGKLLQPEKVAQNIVNTYLEI